MPLSSFLGVREMKNIVVLLKQLFAEFLGTFLFLTFCLLIGSDPKITNVQIALANGLLLGSMVQLVGQISGGHLNPAVTLAVLISGYIGVLKALCYVMVQAGGAIVGAAVAYAISEDSARSSLGLTIPHPNLRVEQIFGLELLMTFILCGVALSVTDPIRHRVLGLGPLAIGLSLTACQCACLSYTGSLNPVRSLGPAVVMNVWTHHWVFWAGPLLGGVFAGVVYRFLLTFRSNVTVDV